MVIDHLRPLGGVVEVARLVEDDVTVAWISSVGSAGEVIRQSFRPPANCAAASSRRGRQSRDRAGVVAAAVSGRALEKADAVRTLLSRGIHYPVSIFIAPAHHRRPP